MLTPARSGLPLLRLIERLLADTRSAGIRASHVPARSPNASACSAVITASPPSIAVMLARAAVTLAKLGTALTPPLPGPPHNRNSPRTASRPRQPTHGPAP